jgi:hypothetical protein
VKLDRGCGCKSRYKSLCCHWDAVQELGKDGVDVGIQSPAAGRYVTDQLGLTGDVGVAEDS